MDFTFMPLALPKIISGRNSINFLGSLDKKKIAIIKGGRSYTPEIQSSIENSAEKMGAEIKYIASIRNEPFIEDIFKYVEDVKAFEPDLILAIGGGSVLDTAKAIHLFYENEDLSFEQSLIPFAQPALGKKAIHVAVPTTAGTGSEVTSAAVFINPETFVKNMILDNGIIPHYAIIDAQVTDSLPNSVLATSGVDALVHAMEACVALNGTAMSKAIAMEAALMIFENLENSMDTNEDIELRNKSRENMLVASTLAGIAITNACTGIAHSYDHPGPRFGIAHGKVCGLILPYTIKYMGVQDTYVKLAKRLGITGEGEELMKNLENFIFEFYKKVGIKTSFKEYDVDYDQYVESAKTWSKISIGAFATQVSPTNMTEEKGMQLYLECYNG